MFGIKNFGNIFKKSNTQLNLKSIQNRGGLPSDKAFAFNTITKEELIQNNVNLQHALNNRYGYVQSVVGSIINTISGTCASLPCIVRDRTTEKEITSKTTDYIYNIVSKPSLEQQSYYQLIYDAIFEYTLNGYLCLMLDNTDIKNPKISVIESNRITCQSQNNNYITSLIIFNKAKQTQESYSLDIDNNCYICNGQEKYLFTSDVYFNNANTINVLLSRSILNYNYQDILTIVFAKNKNNYLIKNKDDTNIVLFSTIDNEILTPEDEIRIKESIQSAMSSVNNGKSAPLFTSTPVKSDLLKLNDGKFESQFDNLILESMKNIYRSYQYPILKDLEQSKYDNAYYAQINFLEQCLMPRLEYVYSVLSRLFNFLLNDNSFYIYFDITKSIEYKMQESIILNRNSKVMTIKEYREKIGLPPLNDERDKQLIGSFATNNYLTDDSF